MGRASTFKKLRREARAAEAYANTEALLLKLADGEQDIEFSGVTTGRSSSKSALFGQRYGQSIVDELEGVSAEMDVHEDWRREGKAKKGGRTKWPDVRKIK